MRVETVKLTHLASGEIDGPPTVWMR